MKKYFYIFCGLILSTPLVYSASDSGVFGDAVTGDELRRGDIHIDDIPNMIRGAIDFLLGLSGTIAIVFIIYGAYKILFSGFEGGDSSRGKSTIIMALSGFAIAALAWFIIRFLLDNFTQTM